MQDTKYIFKMFDDLNKEESAVSAKDFLDSLSHAVSVLGYKPDEYVSNFMDMGPEMISRFIDIMFSCIYGLGNANESFVDERNKYSHEVCSILLDYTYGRTSDCNLGFVKYVGEEFLKLHRTLQQSIMGTFFLFIEKYADADSGEQVRKTMKKMTDAAQEKFGEYWWNTPYI